MIGMKQKEFVGTYYSIDTVFHKIVELTSQGYAESDIYAITQEQDNISMLQGKTDIDLSGGDEDNWMDRFKVFLSGEEPLFHELKKMGFSEEDAQKYTNEVKDGGINLFVDLNTVETDSYTELDRNGQAFDSQVEIEEVTIPRTNTENL